MKCKECIYHEEDDVCYDQCGKAAGNDDKHCYTGRVREGMSEATCVWNCEFCRNNKEVKNAK